MKIKPDTAIPLHDGWLAIIGGFAAWGLTIEDARRWAKRNKELWAQIIKPT